MTRVVPGLAEREAPRPLGIDDSQNELGQGSSPGHSFASGLGTAVLVAASEEVVADDRPGDRNVLAGRHELVAALGSGLEKHKGSIDKFPTFTTDGVQHNRRIVGMGDGPGFRHRNHVSLSVDDVERELQEIVTVGVGSARLAGRARPERLIGSRLCFGSATLLLLRPCGLSFLR